MSMGSIPNSGDVLEIEQMENIKELKNILDIHLQHHNCDNYDDLYSMTGGYLELNEDIFIIKYDSDHGGPHDDLSDGLYILFNEDMLYTKQLTKFGKKLESQNMLPEFKHWETFG